VGATISIAAVSTHSGHTPVYGFIASFFTEFAGTGRNVLLTALQ